MGLFDRGSSYRLSDHEPEKKKKEREIQTYKPPKPLSWLSCGILIALGAVLLAFAAVVLYMRMLGVRVDAATFTTLDETGAVVAAPPTTVTSTLNITFADEDGVMHAGTVSLMGNIGGTVGDTIAIRYLPSNPGRIMLASQTDEFMIPFGSLLLGLVLPYVAVKRLREIRAHKDENAPDD